MFTEEELERIEEQASQIRNFYDYPKSVYLKENLQDIIKEGKKLEEKGIIPH